MPETKDPIAALDAKDIPTRAAGARDLSLAGTPEHIARLLQTATKDVSPGVRLAAAAAAADILSRHRLPPRRSRIADEARAAWLSTVVSVDPGVNTGLFAVCGCLSTEAAFHRVMVGLRDPRQDVRAGACVGLWRAVASASVGFLANVEAQVVATLRDQRIRIETRVEIARICANVGFVSALEAARELPGQCVRHTQKHAEELVVRLEVAPLPNGLWVRTGLDAGAVDPKCSGNDVLLVLSATDTVMVTATNTTRSALPLGWRLLSIRSTPKEPAESVLQFGNDTWWPGEGEEIVRLGDRLLAQGRAELLTACDEALGSSASALRVRGVALLAAGKPAEALLAFEAAVSGKKAPADVWWFLAEALAGVGRAGEGIPHLEKFLSKAAKKAPHVAEAKARIGG